MTKGNLVSQVRICLKTFMEGIIQIPPNHYYHQKLKIEYQYKQMKNFFVKLTAQNKVMTLNQSRNQNQSLKFVKIVIKKTLSSTKNLKIQQFS